MTGGLDGIRALCEAIGNPQTRFESIHVAGTNGKGSVCHMLASIYQQAGFRTGLYTSPHLEDVTERVRINGIPIPDAGMDAFDQAAAAYLIRHSVSYFEYTTAMAFWWFAQRKVDIAIIETGLGGRLDATNILTPLRCVVTSIGPDHQAVLGPTLSDIAREKAGILKPGVPAVVGPVPEECRVHFETHPEVTFVERPLPLDSTDVVSAYSGLNAAIATAAVAHPIDPDLIRLGLASTVSATGLKGRFERLRPDRDWYFDGAHNAPALQSLMDLVEIRYPGRTPVWVVSIMKDKLTEPAVAVLNRMGGHYVAMDSPRAATFEDLTAAGVIGFTPLFGLDPQSPPFAPELNLVMLTGSFYFYTTAKSRLSAS